MEYRIEHGACIPVRVHTVVISVQHSEEISLEDMRKELMEKVVKVRERKDRGREGRREREMERERERGGGRGKRKRGSFLYSSSRDREGVR